MASLMLREHPFVVGTPSEILSLVIAVVSFSCQESVFGPRPANQNQVRGEKGFSCRRELYFGNAQGLFQGGISVGSGRLLGNTM